MNKKKGNSRFARQIDKLSFFSYGEYVIMKPVCEKV